MEMEVETLKPSSLPPTAFIKCSVPWDREVLAQGQSWLLPQGAHRPGGQQAVTLGARGLREEGGGAIRSEGALRLRGQLARSNVLPLTQIAQCHVEVV